MTHNNITSFPKGELDSPITLDKVVLAMENWRASKKNIQDPIPDSIWQQIVALLDKFPEATVRAATGITSTQLTRKLKERNFAASSATSLQSPSSIHFCEVKEEKSPALYKPAKVLTNHTLIVEFCRADNQIMKIHTTTASFADLMKAFFEGN